MADIVERLKAASGHARAEYFQAAADEYDEAAAEIERLRQECEDHIARARTFADGLAVTQMQVDRLRAALRHAVEIAENKIVGGTWDDILEYRKLLSK